MNTFQYGHHCYWIAYHGFTGGKWLGGVLEPNTLDALVHINDQPIIQRKNRPFAKTYKTVFKIS